MNFRVTCKGCGTHNRLLETTLANLEWSLVSSLLILPVEPLSTIGSVT